MRAQGVARGQSALGDCRSAITPASQTDPEPRGAFRAEPPRSRPSKTGARLPRAAKIRCASHTPIFVLAVAVRTQSTIYPALRTHLAPHSPQSPTRRPASRTKAAYVHVLPPPLAPRVFVGVGCSRGRDDHSGHGRAPFRRRGALSDPEPQLSRALREASTGWLRVVVPSPCVVAWCAATANRESARAVVDAGSYSVIKAISV